MSTCWWRWACRIENITLTDIKGVVHKDRGDDMPPNMARYARKTDARTLGEVLAGADVFLGLSAPNVLKPEWLPQMATKPLILALANPDPEILPEVAKAARPDAIIATGRSDYVNQVNNVLCFPFVFRGALDVDATTINEPMKVAAVEAIAALARAEASDVVASAYGGADARLRARLHHSQAVRSAPDPAHRARGGARRHGIAAWRAGPSPISTPMRASWRSSSIAPAS